MEFVSTLWSIWLLRNNISFNNSLVSPRSIIKLAHHWKQRWDLGNNTKTCEQWGRMEDIVEADDMHQRSCSNQANDEPANQRYIIIIDGAWKKVDSKHSSAWRAAVGWVIKDRGIVIWAKVQFLLPHPVKLRLKRHKWLYKARV
ncbi:uncharacterized protein LOC110689520 [Chenopodium quinoa]|uniref:Uncharacterized protein n=1 Tax=Chenopodium quinoa TaxID=63459 RepID=A0A803LMK1_CHEQI|nr:uncharacterized protein LOC110689520 [Chenopodium quinoa]